MKTIVISKPNYTNDEYEIVGRLFEAGLEIFHLRKPKYTKKEIIRFLEVIPFMHRNRVVLHSHFELCEEYSLKGIHTSDRKLSLLKRLKKLPRKKKPEDKVGPSFHKSKSVHSLTELKKNRQNLDYIFLSPIYNSISKRRYKGKFSDREKLTSTIAKTKHKVIALGGIDSDKIAEVQSMGFAGVGLLGSIWKADDPVEAFLKIKAECDREIKENELDLNVVQKTYRIMSSRA